MPNLYDTDLFHINQQELVQRAAHERLIRIAVRARRRNRRAARAAFALRRASEAVVRAGEPVSDRRSSVPTGR